MIADLYTNEKRTENARAPRFMPKGRNARPSDAAHTEECSCFGKVHIWQLKRNEKRRSTRLCGESETCDGGILYAEDKPFIPSPCSPLPRHGRVHMLRQPVHTAARGQWGVAIHSVVREAQTYRRNTVCGRQAVHSVHAAHRCAHGRASTRLQPAHTAVGT